MKRRIKNALIVMLAGVMVGVVLLLITFALPVKGARTHVKESLYTMTQEIYGEDATPLRKYIFEIKDSFTDYLMVQNALDLTVDSQMLETAAETWATEEEDIPAWAKSSLTILAEHGVDLPANGELTRADAAKLLYQTNRLSATAPGMTVIRMHQ